MRSRIASICQHFPGYTAEALWRARFADWIVLATAADQFDREIKEARAKASRTKH